MACAPASALKWGSRTSNFMPSSSACFFRTPLGKIYAHCDGNEGDRLACEHLEIVGASRIVDALGAGVWRRSRQRQCERQGPEDIPLSHTQSSLFRPRRSKYRLAAQFVRRAD